MRPQGKPPSCLCPRLFLSFLLVAPSSLQIRRWLDSRLDKLISVLLEAWRDQSPGVRAEFAIISYLDRVLRTRAMSPSGRACWGGADWRGTTQKLQHDAFPMFSRELFAFALEFPSAFYINLQNCLFICKGTIFFPFFKLKCQLYIKKRDAWLHMIPPYINC